MAARPAPEASPNVTRLVPYRPGKPIEEVKRELGLTDVIKLASNENALGPSPLALAALHQAAERVHLYPDGSCHDLRSALAHRVGVPEASLVFGNGSDELIHYLGLALLRPGDEVIQADPSFVRYEAAAILNEAPCHLVPLKDWRHDLPAMADRIDERTRLVFLANPNNPTGTIVDSDEVACFMDRVPDRVVVVFDEAYAEYVEDPGYPDTLRLVREGQNVVVLRTFSKIYGLAGLRVGYGVARPEIVALIDQVREPFNVSLVAQAAAQAALDDAGHVRRSQENNRCGRDQLCDAFEQMGLSYASTHANFVWVDVGRHCDDVFRELLKAGVIVRTGDIFGAETHLRVTIGLPEQNARFLQALSSILGK